jgi:hypothetical protein
VAGFPEMSTRLLNGSWEDMRYSLLARFVDSRHCISLFSRLDTWPVWFTFWALATVVNIVYRYFDLSV